MAPSISRLMAQNQGSTLLRLLFLLLGNGVFPLDTPKGLKSKGQSNRSWTGDSPWVGNQTGNNHQMRVVPQKMGLRIAEIYRGSLWGCASESRPVGSEGRRTGLRKRNEFSCYAVEPKLHLIPQEL